MGSLFKAMFGTVAGTPENGPYVHTFTVGVSELPDWLVNPDSDAEFEARDWWEDNDPEAESLLFPPAFTFDLPPGTRWEQRIDEDGYLQTELVVPPPDTEETP